MRTLVLSTILFLTLTALANTPIAPKGEGAEKPGEEKFPSAEMPPLVHKEIEKTKQDLQAKLNQTAKLLADLEDQRTKAFARSKTQAQVDLGGVEYLNKYDALISARYVDDRHEYDPGIVISKEDLEAINKLFENYLQMKPLQGVVSSGQARRTLKWGVDRLKEISDERNSPNEENNSDYQIIAKQKKDAERKMEELKHQASKLGFDLNGDPTGYAEAPAQVVPTGDAAPAASKAEANGPTESRAPASSGKGTLFKVKRK